MASIEKRVRSRSISYRVVWRENGQKQGITFGTEDEARRFCKLVEGSGGRWPAGWEPQTRAVSEGLTFGQWAREAIQRRTRAGERTRADYVRDLDRHFALLNGIPLEKLNEAHVIAWMADRRAVPLAEKTIRNLHGFGSSIMADALSQYPPLASHNPFANRLGERASVRVEEMVFVTPTEFGLILSNVPDERGYRELVRLLYGTGLRYGEATALRVRDVDLLGKRKVLTVTRAWKRTDSKTYVVGEPKTAKSRRTISLGAELVDMLIPLVAGRKDDELIFRGTDGGRLPHIEVYKRAWAPAVARANVCEAHRAPQRDRRGRPKALPEPCDCAGVLGKSPRIHDLRHSHVSALIAEGVPLPAISRRLGHASVTVTIDRYGHLDPALDDAINAATDRALALH